MKKTGLIVLVMAVILLLITAPALARYNPPPPPEKPNSTLKIYGEPLVNAKERWDNYSEPFLPTSYPKDVVFFNPAYFPDAGMSANSTDIDEKVYLRLWYEPIGVYWGDRKTLYYPTINLEYIYMFMDSQDKMPVYLTPGDSWFYFPTKEKANQTGLGEWEQVQLASVSSETPVSPYGKTVYGTIRIQKDNVLLSSGQSEQFLDHEVTFLGTSKDGKYAIVQICYTGNYQHADAACKVQILEQSKTYFVKRHNELFTSPRHPDATWYIHFVFKTQEHQGLFIIGKELSHSDTFYVNGVRYDVTAIEVLDTNGNNTADAFKYIALRTKLPKGEGEVMEESVVSTQRVTAISVNETLPLLPPFNMNHNVIDDINVPLWVPLKNIHKFPEGDPNGVPGVEYFPGGEKFVTMQCPPYQWLKFFAAVPLGAQPITEPDSWDTYGPWIPSWCDVANMTWKLDNEQELTWPANVTPNVEWNVNDWVAFDVSDRIVTDIPPLVIYYISESIDWRFSTNLLEKLEQEDSTQYWGKFDIETLPDMYTEFVLPPQKDSVIAFRADQVDYTITMPGDYLIKTSLIAVNSLQWQNNTNGGRGGELGNVTFWFDEENKPILRISNASGDVVSIAGSNDGVDIYVNANPFDYTDNVTVRIYGDLALASKVPGWDKPDEVFNPTAIRKDSITFDPAIIRWSNMSAGSEDAYEKVYYRVWYEPSYPFSKYHAPSVVTETTYLLIDAQDYQPLPATPGDSWFAFPVYATLDDGKALGLDKLDLVALEDVFVYQNNKTIKGGIKISKGYILNVGDSVQFMDHKVSYVGTDLNGTVAILEVCYVGNIDGDQPACKEVTLNASTDYYFKRHNEYIASDNPWTAAASGYPFQVHYVFKLQHPKNETGPILLTLGRVLMYGDAFYVDGVKYEITAVETLPTESGDAFKFITLRTPFPKTMRVDDGNKVSSQWVEQLPANTPVPVLPPFNAVHDIVDDTDVVLWYPLKHTDKWPFGDPHGVLGVEYFPDAERYLTMQHPPYKWLKFFRAVPIGAAPVTDWQLWDNYGGPFYPPDDPCLDTVWSGWIACDVSKRIIENVDPLVYYWVNETEEYRYSTNLLEILWEEPEFAPVEYWEKIDIQTLPDLYTEFKLPKIPSIKPLAYIGGDYQGYFKPDIRDYPGSYIITTSFLAPNGDGNLNVNQSWTEIVRYAFAFNASYGIGLYLNEDPVVEPIDCSWLYHLKQGSNYISMVAIPDNTDPYAVFGTDIEIWAWDASTQDWYHPTSLEGMKGYVLVVPEDRDVLITGTNVEGVTWATIKDSLAEGWNFVGPGDTDVQIVDLNSQAGPIIAILKYDRATGTWVNLGQGDILERGNAYWILVGTPPSP